MEQQEKRTVDQGPAMTWRHPTGRTPETVMVVALGPTKQDLLELTTAHEPNPMLMGCDEWWGINGGVNHLGGRVQYDVLWVMDWIEQEARKEKRYGDALRHACDPNGRNIPIITSQATGEWADMANVHEYPLLEVIRTHGRENAYFHNSIPYILAYALMIGVKRLVLFGADYSHEAIKRREEDRPNAEGWVMYCRAKGMEVMLPDSTTLMNTSRGIWFYGYRDQPVSLLKGPAQSSTNGGKANR
jgi:hypothetical protein